LEDKAQLEVALLETARTIASKSPVGVYTIKQVLKKAESKDYHEGLDNTARMNSVMLQTKDMTEAVSSFLMKKAPVFPKL
jgi:Delta3,5-Delta2,4-dienoyl-CoA isomerase